MARNGRTNVEFNPAYYGANRLVLSRLTDADGDNGCDSDEDECAENDLRRPTILGHTYLLSLATKHRGTGTSARDESFANLCLDGPYSGRVIS